VDVLVSVVLFFGHRLKTGTNEVKLLRNGITERPVVVAAEAALQGPHEVASGVSTA
jgi:hypothetical protein